MKKFFYLAVFCLLASTSPVSAANYFSLRTRTTTPVNDTLRISPNLVGTYCPMFVTANFDGYLDHWDVQFTYPDDMLIDDVFESGTDMLLPYTRVNGTDSVYNVILTMLYKDIFDSNNSRKAYFSATSNVFGYWDSNGDGYYEQYGTVKWATGSHNDMFKLWLRIPSGSTVIPIGIRCDLSSTLDWRGVPTVNMNNINQTLYLLVAFLRGDANGDDAVNVADVNTITDWLYTGLDGINPYKITAADMDGDGDITVHDAILLIDYISTMSGSNDYDYEPLI